MLSTGETHCSTHAAQGPARALAAVHGVIHSQKPTRCVTRVRWVWVVTHLVTLVELRVAQFGEEANTSHFVPLRLPAY